MLALIVPVTLEKLPAINEKYDMAKALEDNVLQNYVKASTDAKQEKNPDEILQEKAGFEDDLRIELPDAVRHIKGFVNGDSHYIFVTSPDYTSAA